MAEPDRSTTERGFVIYDEFTDTYGAGICVQESSSAEGPRVWIFARRDAAQFLTPGDLERLSRFDLRELACKLAPSPHLNVEQARRVRDALDVFIREHEEARGA